MTTTITQPEKVESCVISKINPLSTEGDIIQKINISFGSDPILTNHYLFELLGTSHIYQRIATHRLERYISRGNIILVYLSQLDNHMIYMLHSQRHFIGISRIYQGLRSKYSKHQATAAPCHTGTAENPYSLTHSITDLWMESELRAPFQIFRQILEGQGSPQKTLDLSENL